MAKFQDLDPKKQAALFAAMQSLGGLSVDTGESQDTQDPQAQAGITAQTNANPVAAQAQKNAAGQDNSTDYSQIQNLWRDAQNPSSQVTMQPGDKMHPADAIAQVVQNMQQGSDQGAPPTQNAPGQTAPPTAPGQTPQPVQGPMNGPAPSPQIAQNDRLTQGSAAAIPNAPANSWIGRLTGQTIPGYSAQVPAQGLIPRLLGMKASVPLGNTNYYDAAKQGDLLKFLPTGLPQLPDGTPLVNKDAYDVALASKRNLQNPNNPPVSLDDAKDLGIISKPVYDNLIAAGHTGPETQPATVWRLATGGAMASARQGLVALGQTKLQQSMIEDLIDGISDANKTPAAQSQVNTLNWAVHGRQILNTPGVFDPQTGQYNIKPQQLAELTMDLNRMFTGSSQVSESARDDIQASTAKGDFAKLAQYAGVNSFNGTPQQLATMYRDLLDKQGQTAQALAEGMYARQVPRGQLLKAVNPGAYQAVLDNSFGTTNYDAVMKSSPDAAVQNRTPVPNLGGRGTIPPRPIQQPPAQPQMVRVKSPTGQTGSIPAANLKAALAKGYVPQ